VEKEGNALCTVAHSSLWTISSSSSDTCKKKFGSHRRPCRPSPRHLQYVKYSRRCCRLPPRPMLSTVRRRHHVSPAIHTTHPAAHPCRPPPLRQYLKYSAINKASNLNLNPPSKRAKRQSTSAAVAVPHENAQNDTPCYLLRLPLEILGEILPTPDRPSYSRSLAHQSTFAGYFAMQALPSCGNEHG